MYFDDQINDKLEPVIQLLMNLWRQLTRILHRSFEKHRKAVNNVIRATWRFILRS